MEIILQKSLWLSLQEAVDEIMELLPGIELDKAKTGLVRACYDNIIRTRGIDEGYSNYDYKHELSNLLWEPAGIQQIDWEFNGFAMHRHGHQYFVLHVEINGRDLRNWCKRAIIKFPDTTAPLVSAYIPPYILFMLDGINKMGLCDSKSDKHENIKDWFRTNWPAHLGEPSDTKLRMMATFVRMPEAAKGGNLGKSDSRRKGGTY